MIIEERSKHSAIFSKKRDMRDLRVLRGPEPGFYIIVLKLSSVSAASAFIQEFHQKKYNSMEPDLCEVYILDQVTFDDAQNTEKTEHSSQISTSGGLSPEILFEEQDQQEQSNCPICLEANHDSSVNQVSTAVDGSIDNNYTEKLKGGQNGLTITILCGHQFHWMCLKDWSDSTCPLCRYHQCP